jgi:NDP-sugar pyrophosphorylase family protein
MDTLLTRAERVKSYPFEGRWLDIGVPADYERAEEDVERNRVAYMPWTTLGV